MTFNENLKVLHFYRNIAARHRCVYIVLSQTNGSNMNFYKQLLVIAAISLLTVSYIGSTNQNGRSIAKIINGRDATLKEFPWQVTLRKYFHFCGGVIISDKFILTAAHCVIDKTSDEISVTGGGSGAIKDQMMLSKVRKITIHPDYIESLSRADIALIELDKNISFSSTIAPIALPVKNIEDEIEYADYGNIATSGWGKTEDRALSKQLQALNNLELLPSHKSSFWHNIFNHKIITNSVFSPGYNYSYKMFKSGDYLGVISNNGKSSCYGDSGGGLVQVDERVLIGINSHVYDSDCKKSKASNFTNVFLFRDWIYETMVKSIDW